MSSVTLGVSLFKSDGPMTDDSQPTKVYGFFDYCASKDGWSDSFRVIDDDGMPFHLDDLKKWQGIEVCITISRLSNQQWKA